VSKRNGVKILLCKMVFEVVNGAEFVMFVSPTVAFAAICLLIALNVDPAFTVDSSI